MLNTSNDQRKLLPNFEHLFATTAQAPGGVARLRELILTLAVQGKLVPQDASDEPASELLKKIREEKDRLIAEGKIKKDKPLPEITDEEKPFELPVGWEWVRLGNLVDVLDNLRKPVTKENRKSGSYPYYGASGIVDYVDEYIFDEPLVLVGEDGAKWAAGERTAFEIDGKTWVNNHAHVLRPKRFAVLDSYLVIYLTASDLSDYITGMTVPKLNQARLVSIPIPLAPLAEQSRIITRVEELMRLCDALEEKGRLEHTQHQQLLQAMLDSLTQTTDAHELARHWQRLAQHFDLLIDRPEAVDALEQTILQLAVRGLLVEQDANDEPASELLAKINKKKKALIDAKLLKIGQLTGESKFIKDQFTLPRSWSLVKAVELLFVTKLAGFEYTKHISLEDEGEVPVVRAQNVRPFNISKSNLKYIDERTSNLLERCALIKSSLLVTFIGAGIGDVAIFEESNRWHLAPNVAKMEPFSGCEDLINLHYFNYYLNSSYGRQEIFKHIQSTAQPSISMGTIRDIDLPLPPLAEQSRIVARVTELRALCQQLREKLTQARTTQTQLAQAWVEQAAA